MAVSLALNWSPPASSPLLEDGAASSLSDCTNLAHNGNSAGRKSDTLQQAPYEMQSQYAGRAPTSKTSHAASASPDRRIYRQQSPQQSQGVSGSTTHRGAPSLANGNMPQAKSYASVASSAGATSHSPATSVPSYNGANASAQGQQNTAFHAQANSGAPWSSPYYQGQMGQYYAAAPQAAGSSPAAGYQQSINHPVRVSEDGRRLRSYSSAAAGQRHAPPLTYNDTLQHYPGMQSAASSRSSLPFENTAAEQLNNNSSNGAYHPYRRAPRPSDSNGVSSNSSSDSMVSGVPSASISQGPPVLPMPSHVSPLGLPGFPQRARASSNASSVGTTKAEPASVEPSMMDASPAGPGASYSSFSSGGVRPSQSTPNLAAYTLPNPSEERSHHSSSRPNFSERNASQTSVDRSRPDQPATSAYSGAHNSNFSAHLRTDSTSSSQHSSDFSHSSGATTATTARSGFSPSNRKPASSPLAYSNRGDESTETAYAGSDDEHTIGGRSTPTPGEKQRKGLSGKLRKALSLSTLQQVEAAAAAPDRAYGGRANVSTRRGDTFYQPQSSGDTNGSSGSTRSTSPPRTPDNGAPLSSSSAASITSRRSTRPPLSNGEGASSKRSIFRSKFNASTDNISISSTVSSASMVLRKVGNLGKLARRSNLKGITNIFKDKEDGREGLHGDDFGTLPVASDEVAAAMTGQKDKSKAKKSAPATTAVSHATVEMDHTSNGSESMTPAASYVRQHQLQMRKQAEAEQLAREKAEAEKAAAAASARAKTKSTDDVTEGRQKMIEKEKERLKSKRGWRKRLGVGSLGSSSDVQKATGLEVVPLDESSGPSGMHDIPGGYSVPPSGQNKAAQRGGFNEMSYDSAFGEEELDPPHMPAADEYDSAGDEFETDSLRHWGEGIERSRESAARVKYVRGILKTYVNANDRSHLQQSPASSIAEKPQSSRVRSNSYDAPQAGNTSASVPPISHITSAATDRVDGLPRSSDADKVPSDDYESRARSPSNTPSTTSQGGFGHHANSSMPTLSMMMHPSPTGHRSVTAPIARKRLVFADNHIYHSTWPAHIYDRRGELATCNRLTPLLAQRIKEELNTYKMEEMAVAPSSRIHTHFFV